MAWEVGMVLLVGSTSGAIISWVFGKVSLFRTVGGVRFRSLFWEGADRTPLPGTPVMVKVRFHRPSYGEEFQKLNEYASSWTLEGIRSMARAEMALEAIIPDAEARLREEFNREVRDSWHDSWDISSTLSMILMIFSAGLVYAYLTGSTRPDAAANRTPLLAVSLAVFMTSTGVLLRIEASRRVAAILTAALAVLATAYLGWKVLSPPRKADWWGLIGAPLGLWWYAWALNAAPTRRMCTKWGRLGRLFTRKPAA